MEAQLVKSSFLDLAKRKKKWVFLFTAFGFTSYSLYRICHSPSTNRKRKRLLKLFDSFISLSEAISNSAEAISVVSRDFKGFIQSETDEIPNSFIQISKLGYSTEFSNSVITLSQALTLGILRGQKSVKQRNDEKPNSSLFESVIDKLFTTAGSGFASIIVGSFARNLVMGFYSNGSESNSIDKWVNHLSYNEKSRELVYDCIRLFVSSIVAVFLENTMHINTYDQFFAGLTNPDHEERVKDLLVSVCNGAVETFMKTSNGNVNSISTFQESGQQNHSNPKLYSDIDWDHCDEFEDSLTEFEGDHKGLLSDKKKRFFLDVTGKVTYETVRSVLEYFVKKLNGAMRRFVDGVHETGVEISRYVTCKTSVLATVCLSVCLHIVDSAWILVPA